MSTTATIGNHMFFSQISERSARDILGMTNDVPLVPQTMAGSLHITFFPTPSATPRVRAFVDRLNASFLRSGVSVIPYEEALSDPAAGKLREGLVIIAAGEIQTGDLPVDHVANLRQATIVGIVDGPCPADRAAGLQEQLNSVVQTLAWNIVQLVVYVDDTAWTVATMNGAIVRFTGEEPFDEAVLSILIPKLAAPVVPPRASDFEVREGSLDLHKNGCAPYAHDFADSGPLWAKTGLMLFHTSLESLEFRNRYYKRIAAAYLDHRSGMSYGFLARQLPVDVHPAVTLEEAERRAGRAIDPLGGVVAFDSKRWVPVDMPGGPLLAPVPDVWVLTTRSGCDKSNIAVDRDIVMMGLVEGRIIFETPGGTRAHVDCKPSYDTQTILAHGVANAIAASILERLKPGGPFAAMLRSKGLALAHWHGLIHRDVLPPGYHVHGDRNPPVSCSTYQSAIYALTGKLKAVRESLDGGRDFIGDVHVEPFHGTNITGPTLRALGEWILEMLAHHGVTRFAVQPSGLGRF